jgi:hypothetical protein
LTARTQYQRILFMSLQSATHVPTVGLCVRLAANWMRGTGAKRLEAAPFQTSWDFLYLVMYCTRPNFVVVVDDK